MPERTIKLLFVADEEVGSKHGIQYLPRKIFPFQQRGLILIPDGGNAEGTEIEVAEKNILWLKVRTIGKQTHAAMPDKGVNAFLAASDLALPDPQLLKRPCLRRGTPFSNRTGQPSTPRRKKPMSRM